jgi:hypothetical protein
MKDLDNFYISACNYDNDENILYTYHVKTNKLEKMHSVDLETFFFCDEISNTIYKYKQSDEELLIYKMHKGEFICIYKEKSIENNHLADIYSIDNNIFIKLQNDDTNIFESYLILENNKYRIDNNFFSDSIHRPHYIDCEGNKFLVIDDSNFEAYELSEIRENTIGNIDLSNRITLYNLSEFIEEIKNNKVISKKVLVESECNKESVQLLGVYKNNILVLYNKNTPQILVFDVNNNYKNISVNSNIIDILKEKELYYIYKNEEQLGLLNEKQEQVFCINYSNKDVRISIVGIFDSKYVIYKKDYYEEERIETYICDLASNKHLKYDSDFVLIEETLI